MAAGEVALPPVTSAGPVAMALREPPTSSHEPPLPLLSRAAGGPRSSRDAARCPETESN
jgi:hypothetical protein